MRTDLQQNYNMKYFGCSNIYISHIQQSGAIQVLRNAFSQEIGPPPTPS